MGGLLQAPAPARPADGGAGQRRRGSGGSEQLCGAVARPATFVDCCISVYACHVRPYKPRRHSVFCWGKRRNAYRAHLGLPALQGDVQTPI